ncbi:hypothetical protein chiPu_0033887, partial [Chiloscyllium punctatum]|nr:hypothetical protein [Chiloscyllium punctatum]
MLDGAVAGHDIDPPAPSRNMIQRGTVFGEMQGMDRPVEHVDRRDQHDPRRDSGKRSGRDERIERFARKDAAVAALRQPLRQREHEIEAELFGAEREIAIVVERPRRRARQGRRAPATSLDRQEQAKQQRLLQRFRQRTFRKLAGARKDWPANDVARLVHYGHI